MSQAVFLWKYEAYELNGYMIGVDMWLFPEVDGFFHLVVHINFFSKWS